jgi:hypothetical protein
MYEIYRYDPINEVTGEIKLINKKAYTYNEFKKIVTKAKGKCKDRFDIEEVASMLILHWGFELAKCIHVNILDGENLPFFD